MRRSDGSASSSGLYARGSASVLSRAEPPTVGCEPGFESGAPPQGRAGSHVSRPAVGAPVPDLNALPGKSAADEQPEPVAKPQQWLAESAVVDLFFWILHDGRGVRQVSTSTADLVLAAALLWDIRDFVAVGDDGITVIRREVLADPLEAEILWYLAAEETHRHPTAVWLEFIANHEVYERTASRLVSSGNASVRGGLRKRYEATNIASTWPGARLMAVFRAQKRFNDQDVILAALVLAAGLQKHVLYEHTASAVVRARQQIDAGPTALRALYRAVAAAVGKAVEVHR